MAIIFEGKDLRLGYLSNASTITFVSFSHWRTDKHPIRTSSFSGFASGFAHRMGYNEFNVDTSRNHWYQTEEIFEVIRLIKEHNPVGAKIITYGSSMGAYASINFAELLNADRFIAISPQFSMHPEYRPSEESRWKLESKLLDFNYDFIRGGGLLSRQGYIFYDKESLDVHHAVPILNNTSAIGFHIPLGGHPCGRVLNQSYGLKAVMREVAEGLFDAAKFYSHFNKAFLDSFPYLVAHLHEAGNFEKLNRAVCTSELDTKDLRLLLISAIASQDIRIKKLALFVYSYVSIKPDDLELVRALKIQLLLQLKLQRDALLEIVASSQPYKAETEQLISHYQNLTELSILLPLLVKLHPVSFRNAAFKCVKWNPERALILMKHTFKLRPNNLQIKQKVIEYQERVDKTQTVQTPENAIQTSIKA